MICSATYRRLVLAALAISFIAIAWGGLVRATGSGMGCADEWPLCQGGLFPDADADSRIEWIHRVLALADGAAVIALAWASRRHRGLTRTLAYAAVPLFFMQAVLGAIAVWLHLRDEWVTLHFANAQLLVGTLAALYAHVRWPALAGAERTRRWTALIVGTAGAIFVLQLSGAYVRGAGATAACGSWPFCSGDLLLPATGAPALHMLHRYLAAAAGVLVVYAALAAWRRRREIPGAGALAAWTLGLFVLQIAVGAAMPLTAFNAVPLALHPTVASALWCAVVALAVVAWRPPERASEALRDVVALTKPAIMSLLLLTAVGGAFLAADGVPPLAALVGTVVGGALASGGASSLNHYFDRDIDERMRRTRRRPLPAHRIPGGSAVALGIALNILAFGVLLSFANLLAAALATLGTLFYVIVYTIWLKRTTVQNIVVGGAAGAIPPLVGWAAVTGSLELAPWLLFAVVFMWTPPHFWALALLIRDDYARAGVPMLPVVKGDRATARSILAYALTLVPLSAAVYLIGAAGTVYLAAVTALGVVFVAWAVRLVRAGDDRRRAVARGLYLYSLLYLALVFAAIVVDTAVRL
ncbi:MAG TPA: heme o synthase [Candidatus Limnocylindria bacterium]|nr:heme o synthase [Candidatus Limnocylindria bacterium]